MDNKLLILYRSVVGMLFLGAAYGLGAVLINADKQYSVKVSERAEYEYLCEYTGNILMPNGKCLTHMQVEDLAIKYGIIPQWDEEKEE